MKMLFITCNGIENAAFGGAKASIRNYELLKQFGEVNVMTIQKKSNAASAVSILQGYFPPAGKGDLKAVKKSLGEYDLVFFDGSHFGNIIKYVRSQNVKTICFFHNCEYDYIEVRFGQRNSLKKSIYKRLIAKQERLAAQCADRNIAFTQRDAERISRLYKVAIPRIVPLSLIDIYEKRPLKNQERDCLLLGPAGQANEEAFGWFVKNVSPHLHCKTKVAGKGMEAYKDIWAGEKVEVCGYVDDMAQLYADAACVAIPLLSGGGMKIKTAEALMFGKYIFGTDEAFVGYELDYARVGGKCNSAEEFIEKINDFLDTGTDLFNKYSRRMFEDRYSLQASKEAFAEIMDM